MNITIAQHSMMILAWSVMIAFQSETSFAQDDPYLNANGEIQVVYPKRRDFQVRPHPGLLAECKCPKGLHLMWYVVAESDDDFHLADRACGGVARKSEVYSSAELEILDLDQLKDSDDDLWRKMLIARHIQRDGTYASYSQSIKIFVSVMDKNPDELTALFHRSFALAKNQLFDAALLGLNYASELDDTTYEIPYMTGQVLLYKNLMTSVSNRKELFERAYELLRHSLEMTPNRHDTLLMVSICLRNLERYDEVVSRIKSIGHVQNDDTRDILYLVRAEAHAKSKVPNFEKSLQDYQFVIDSTDNELYRLCAVLNMSIIHSTRSDVENRNPEMAIDLLKSLESNIYLSQNTVGYMYANGLACLSFGDFDKADPYIQSLAKMFLGDVEAPELKSIEEAIKNRRPYLPKKSIPLISAKGIHY